MGANTGANFEIGCFVHFAPKAMKKLYWTDGTVASLLVLVQNKKLIDTEALYGSLRLVN